jgi:hypothetical protein
MNNIFKKVLSTVEEFANRSNRLSLVADSMLDRIVPKGTGYAACWQYKTTYTNCGNSTCGLQYRMKVTWKRYCEGSGCGTYCNPWEFQYMVCVPC